ncbi:hypothetical protein VMCG_00982 [Cytospora schulzeri]|uniref:Uncharacterized protein n=1 Tax=Cytospora schulzeri TaxID=448051 RepID=A0A423X6S6_9PEZI|nr:hypothetical protein VMCG_00982 [Valsa malicola]
MSSGSNSGLGGVFAAVSRSITSATDSRGIHKRSDDNRTTVIILSTVLSVLGFFLIVGAVFACIRCHQRRTQLFSRAISPIDDDEIATWKGNRQEKELENGAASAVVVDRNGHRKHESVDSTRKPPSVIVYSHPRQSEERSPRLQNYYGKRSLDGRKMSFDKEVPSTPILARAPNAREGLTDDTVPGDDPFVQSPRRHTSRLSKMPPPTVQQPRQTHTRTKSARSSFSMRSFGDHLKGYDSDVELTPRASQDYQDGPPRHRPARVFSSTSVPPRVSHPNDWPGPSVLVPAPLALVRREDIGRAIG